MRILFLFAVFAGLALAGPPREIVDAFVLYTEFQVRPPDPVRAAIEQELDSVLGVTGWPIVWKLLPAPRDTVSVRLTVVHFRGACDLKDTTKYYPSFRSVFGATYISDGNIIPFADIYCGAIRAFLADALRDVNVKQGEWLFGRAVGRVLAHELYHVLANEKTHGANGIAESGFTQYELLADNFRFSPKDVRKLRAQLRDGGRGYGMGPALRGLVPVALQSYEKRSSGRIRGAGPHLSPAAAAVVTREPPGRNRTNFEAEQSRPDDVSAGGGNEPAVASLTPE